MALTVEEKDQKLLDIAFEPDCNCAASASKTLDLKREAHYSHCAWRQWRERMDRWDGEDQ